MTQNGCLLSYDGATFYYGVGQNIVVQSTVTTIVTGVMAYNDNVVSIDLSNSRITNVPSNAFTSCKNLISVKFPSTLTAFSRTMLGGCSSLELVDMRLAQQVPTLTAIGALPYSINQTFKVVVPDALYSTWITSGNWANANIVGHIVSATDYENNV